MFPSSVVDKNTTSVSFLSGCTSSPTASCFPEWRQRWHSEALFPNTQRLGDSPHTQVRLVNAWWHTSGGRGNEGEGWCLHLCVWERGLKAVCVCLYTASALCVCVYVSVCGTDFVKFDNHVLWNEIRVAVRWGANWIKALALYVSLFRSWGHLGRCVHLP